MSGLIDHLLLTGLSSLSSRDCWILPLEEDYAYLPNLSGSSLEEELVTLGQYTRCASITLALGGTGR